MKTKLLIGVPLHNSTTKLIENLSMIIAMINVIDKLQIELTINISCDADIDTAGLSSFIERHCDLKNVYISLFEKTASGMVDNWNSALKSYYGYDYIYLLHDDDLLERDFFVKTLPMLVSKRPAIIAFNGKLDLIDEDRMIDKIDFSITKEYSQTEYFGKISKVSFPAPSHAIVKAPDKNFGDIYCNFMMWCPEVYLYLKLMDCENSVFIGANHFSIKRTISTNQVSYNTSWKGVVDKIVLAQKTKYKTTINNYFEATPDNVYEGLFQYFKHVNEKEIFYQLENITAILDYVFTDQYARFAFLKHLLFVCIENMSKNQDKVEAISKELNIISKLSNSYYKEKVLRTVEKAIVLYEGVKLNRMHYDYHHLKDLDAKYKENIYSNNYTKDRIAMLVTQVVFLK